jgi:hypothetical protein
MYSTQEQLCVLLSYMLALEMDFVHDVQYEEFMQLMHSLGHA